MKKIVNGKKIRRLREAEGLTIEEFARKVGCGQPFMTHVETGIKQPSVSLLKRIADYFKCTVDDLIKSE